MGMIRVEITGSFKPCRVKTVSAQKNGHAAAVAEIIAWLSSDVLPKAIRQDHDLHEEGFKPDGPFGCKWLDLDNLK